MDGVIPTLALVDELHRHPSSELYGVFRDGLGPRGGQMVTISTAGWDIGSPLGVLRKKAHQMNSFTRQGTYNHSVSPDGSFVMHEWCLENTDDLADMELVKTVNPASWHTIKELRRRHDSPSTTPAQWARFACGVWTAGEKPWLRPEQWDGLKQDRIADGEDVWLSISVGTRAGIAIVAKRDVGAVVSVQVINAPSADERVPLEFVEQTIVSLSKRYRVQEMIYDHAQFGRSAELLSERGLIVQEIPQRTAVRLSTASTTLYRLICLGELLHDGSPQLREQVLGGMTKEDQQGWRLIPTEHTRALIAMAMGVDRATQVPSEPPAFVSL